MTTGFRFGIGLIALRGFVRNGTHKENRLFDCFLHSRPVRANAVNKPGAPCHAGLPFRAAEEDFATGLGIFGKYD